MVKKLAKDTRKLVGVGLGLGVGAAVVGGVATTAGVANVAGPAFVAGGSMLGVAVPVVMGMHTLRLARNLGGKKSKISLRYKMPKKRY